MPTMLRPHGKANKIAKKVLPLANILLHQRKSARKSQLDKYLRRDETKNVG